MRGCVFIYPLFFIIFVLYNNSGNYTVNVAVNDYMTVPFILDTGASHCTIPSYIAFALCKAGSLSEEDYIRIDIYRLADGSLVKQDVFLIKEIRIGKEIIKNVEFSIGTEDNAPLLLGQNALRKLEKININYKKDLLTW